MGPLLAFADTTTLGTVALSALTAFFAYLAGRDRLRFDAKVVLLEKTVSDNADDLTEYKERVRTLEGDYEDCKSDRASLRAEVDALKSREAERHGSPVLCGP